MYEHAFSEKCKFFYLVTFGGDKNVILALVLKHLKVSKGNFFISQSKRNSEVVDGVAVFGAKIQLLLWFAVLINANFCI